MIIFILLIALFSFALGALVGVWWKSKHRSLEPKELQEDLIKGIYQLNKDGYQPSEKYLKNALRCTMSELKSAQKALVQAGYLVANQLQLTEEGHAMALKIIRKHRLYEMYLAERTGYAPKEWHKKAEKMEHKLAEDAVDAIDELLGFPRVDPHGAPIPQASGDIVVCESPTKQRREPERLLTDLKQGEVAVVTGLSRNCRGQARRRLLDLGFVRGSKVSIDLKSPLGNPIAYLVKGSTIALRQDQAQYIYIKR